MRRGLTVIVAVAACLCSGAAPAQEAPSQEAPAQEAPAPRDPVSAVVGTWELSNADHDKVCRFVFQNDSVPGGYRVDIDQNCPALFPSTKTVAAWTVDNYGNLRLIDASGNVVIELSEVESGIYDGFQPEEGRYILQSAAAAPIRSAEEIAGDWAIVRGTGKPICMLTLAADADSLTVQLKPDCDAMVTRFNPTSWRIDNGELVLLSARGQSWRFEKNDANSWQRVPETPDPVLLVRQ